MLQPAYPVDRSRRARRLLLAMSYEERQFWVAYRQWLDMASAADLDRMDKALAELAPHVRPIDQVVADALKDNQAVQSLPPTLIAILTVSGWPPADDLLARALLSVPAKTQPSQSRVA